MRRWDARQIALAAGAQLIGDGPTSGPERVTIDSHEAGPGALFVGLRGEHVDGGQFASEALAAGAWGVLVDETHAPAPAGAGADQAVIVAAEPLAALQQLARAWRRQLGESGMRVIGVTGSTGKTSTKELLRTILAPHLRTVASEANFNTEIGLPLQVLGAPEGTEALVLEMAMRGPGQIAELARIAEPEVGAIVSIGPVHLELLGSLEAIAGAKAEIIKALPAGGTAVIPDGEPLLEPYMRDDLRVLRVGGNVRSRAAGDQIEIDVDGERVSYEINFGQSHMIWNLMVATAAACAIGVRPGGRLEFSPGPGRGEHVELPHGVILIDGAYNANPMSMRAALDELSSMDGRRVAVLGDMLELGPDAASFHRQLGRLARESVDLLITVGAQAQEIGGTFEGEHIHAVNAHEAAQLVPDLIHDGDVILVKGSYGVGLKEVSDSLRVAALR